MQEIQMNNSTIKVEEVNGKTIITIDTTDADIIVNNNCLWSKFDKPEYEHVPVVLRSYIQDKSDFIELKDGVVTADLWKFGTICATFYIPQNKRDDIKARMDFIESMELLEHDYIRNSNYIDKETADALMSKFNQLFSEIEESIKKAGYKFVPSHGTNNGVGGYWDVIFSLDKWNEDAFNTIWEKISLFEDYMNTVGNEFNIYFV